MTHRTQVLCGERLLMSTGYATVVAVHRHGLTASDALGKEHEIAWSDLGPIRSIGPGGVVAAHAALQPTWDMLGEEARSQALDRLEVVLEILTGCREGDPALAREGEPFHPYGPDYGVSLDKRCARMALELTQERDQDRRRQRRILRGELKDKPVSKSTLRLWCQAWSTNGGLLALVDGRKMRRVDGFDVIDADFRGAILAIVETLDGDRSAISHREIVRQARVQLKRAGRTHVPAPQRAVGEYVSWLLKGRGSTTRAHRSNALRGYSGQTSFCALRPGQVVAIDVTRADVLVWDPAHERAFSVEIITALDVATRTVLAVRCVPLSADALDAGLLLYDVMRPFSQVVSGTETSHWRWAGLPRVLDLTRAPVRTERGALSPAATLQGEHRIPSLRPEAIRADHGSIFVSQSFRALLNDFGIDLLLSRGRRPTDNSHVERLHETYQRAWQQLAGFKARSVAGRGRKVAEEPVGTAAELEESLRRWVALDYHQSWHEGLILPGAPTARMTPIELFDAMLSVTGRIDVPQRPDLLYQFLPIRWGTIRHAGVEFHNLTYDARCLDAFRNARAGEFRAQDRAAPFFYDPHDVSRLWFRDPDTDIVHEVPWRGAHLLDAPMTATVLDSLRQRISARGGNLALNKESTQRLILDELTELTTTPSTREWRARISAAARRVETSARDHAEAQEAQADAHARAGNVSRLPARAGERGEVSAHVDEWPDLEADL